ncbi:MAG TPA: efflux RND transporter periplasmic adaptor subunit [Bacteroidales bacterium]|nr:efflux RND transporter periplasmic adaptor subunit [Bacteroidales bacterium]
MKNTVIMLFTTVFLTVSCTNNNPQQSKDESVRVRVTGIQAGAISIPVHSSGILAPSQEIKLSFKTGGLVAGITVKEGQKVKKGDILASLNLSEIRAKAGQAGDAYDKALRDYNRAKNLYSDSVVTLEQEQNAFTALNVAKSNLDIAGFNLKHSEISAPDDGIIMKQLVKENEMVSAGYPVFLFGSSGKHWRIKCGVADRDVVRINKGDTAWVTFDAWPGVRFKAVVSLIGGMSNPYTGTYDTELLLVNPSGYRLVSGFIGNVDIYPSARAFSTLVPVGSLIEADGDHAYVFVVNGSQTAGKVKVKIESVIDTLVAVKGIPEGITRIVTDGAAYLKDGDKVKVVN